MLHVGQEVEVQVLSVDKDKKKIALSIKRAEVDPWTTVEQRYQPGQLVTGVVTKTAPFGAFARIEDGIEGLIPHFELTPGTDPKTVLHEGAQLQLRILRIDAERRRLGLSLRQVDELEEKEATSEAQVEQDVTNQAEVGTQTSATPSLENLPQHQEHAPKRKRGLRRERPNDSSILGRLPDEGEPTAIAEAFRVAPRQRSKEENETSE